MKILSKNVTKKDDGLYLLLMRYKKTEERGIGNGSESKGKDYLRYLKKTSYPQLFDMEGMHKLDNVEKVYGHLETEETILEICLSGGEKSCDYSIRINTDSPSVREYWYELDAGACISREIAPCYFIDASSVKPGQDNDGFYDGPLTKLAGEKG